MNNSVKYIVIPILSRDIRALEDLYGLYYGLAKVWKTNFLPELRGR